MLVVDDDVRNIFALSSVLERRGMHVLTATTGREAIALLESTPDVAIVLMDIMMPEMDGYQTMQVIRAEPGVPAAADHRADRQGDEGRPREVPGGRRLRLPGQAGQHRAAAVGAAHVAASLDRRASMTDDDKVNILLVDDQPAKLLSYEVDPARARREPDQGVAPASEALEHLLKTEIAVVLIDVCMPELDGFELAAMIREHPRFQKTAIIFVSAIHLTDIDRLRGYEMGAVDYVPVPVVPEVLRAKVRVFAELYRKTRQLEQLNAELEERVAERTAELEASTARLRAERGAPQPGARGRPDGLVGLGSCAPATASGTTGSTASSASTGSTSTSTAENVRALIHPDDWQRLQRCARASADRIASRSRPNSASCGPNGEIRWCIGTAAPSVDAPASVVRDQRRHRRHHRSQERRGAPGAAGARGRSPRQERAGAWCSRSCA